MALSVRKLVLPVLLSLAYAFNAFKKEVAAGTGSAKVHADITSKPTTQTDDYTAASTPDVIAAADGAGTLAALRTLCIDIYGVYLRHLADDLAHKTADAAPALTAPTSTSTLAALETFLNAVKADYETHRASTTYHYAADATHTLTSADATDQASADTLANEIKADLNAHMAAALTTPSLKLVAP